MKYHNSFNKKLFKVVCWFIRLFFGRSDAEGLSNIPETDAIIVANHCQMNGPIIAALYMPENLYIWCAGEMMNLREVPAYAFKDFWSQKPEWTHPFYKLLSYIIAPIADWLFNHAQTIAVYRDGRILSTFKATVNRLDEGKNIVIFPEKDEKHNNILYKFQENFVDVAKLYYKRTGKTVSFVPMYNAPMLRTSYVGKPIVFDPENDIADERKRICDYISNEITEIARSLPEHTVIPYRNIPKKHYLKNTDIDKLPY